MTLLIDPPNASGHGRLWSHLASDTTYAELHDFARGLGIPPRGFDGDHYDVPAERYDDVVALGVTAVSSRELVDRLREAGLRRRKGLGGRPRPPGATLLRPERLRPGDRVAVVAPAGPVRRERLERGLAVLASYGLEVTEGDHLRGRHEERPYLAAPDEARAADLERALTEPGVAAVVCARGGYGTQRALDLVDWTAVARVRPRVLVGFSDVTALHQALAARLGWASVHGPGATSLGDADRATRRHLGHLLLEPDRAVDLAPDGLRHLAGPVGAAGAPVAAGGGPVTGPLTGGNLSLLAATLGTRDVRPAAGSIVVLEDVGEQPYRLDRAVTHLIRAGWLDGALAVVLGEFTGGGEPGHVEGMLAERLGGPGGLDVPVLAGAPVGHGRRNLAWVVGVPATLDVAAGTLRHALPPLA